jgi:hypothetical protein
MYETISVTISGGRYGIGLLREFCREKICGEEIEEELSILILQRRL